MLRDDPTGDLYEDALQSDRFPTWFQTMGEALFTLNHDAKVVSANQSAETMLRATTCLKLSQGRLSAAAATENTRLRAAIARAGSSYEGESVALRPAPGSPPEVFLHITRLAGHDNILVTARRRSHVPMVRAKQLQQAFGLTAAEAAVGEALIVGKTPDEYAATAGVSVATVRTQLRAIFEKTGTRSQAEAVGVMLHLPPQPAEQRMRLRPALAPTLAQ